MPCTGSAGTSTSAPALPQNNLRLGWLNAARESAAKLPRSRRSELHLPASPQRFEQDPVLNQTLDVAGGKVAAIDDLADLKLLGT